MPDKCRALWLLGVLGVLRGEGLDQVHLGDEADQGAAVIDDEADLIARKDLKQAARVSVAVDGVNAAEHDLGDGARERRVSLNEATQEVVLCHDPDKATIV